ncbi:hypothetical protein GCM10009679_74420 [Saccharothrix algeriensis]|uniref:Uncharacterized protein n=1 Tax=Catellatospora bangladeshensis TaxID=310355 RepID=A0A8J3JSX2_9ACTN|nr:hypothetical protein Cba03nite_45430 [Catellatospora bangladeshensis]
MRASITDPTPDSHTRSPSAYPHTPARPRGAAPPRLKIARLAWQMGECALKIRPNARQVG